MALPLLPYHSVGTATMLEARALTNRVFRRLPNAILPIASTFFLFRFHTVSLKWLQVPSRPVSRGRLHIVVRESLKLLFRLAYLRRQRAGRAPGPARRHSIMDQFCVLLGKLESAPLHQLILLGAPLPLHDPAI